MASDVDPSATLLAETTRRLASGDQVESKSDVTTVLVGGDRLDHLLHLVQRTVITVDASGTVSTSVTKQRAR